MLEQNTNHIAEEQLSEALLSTAPERAIIVGVDIPGNDWPVEESLNKLAQLARTAGVTSVDRVIQRLPKAHPGTLLGSGKIQEIAELARFHNCDAVIFNLELSPGQHRNLELELEKQVLDRTALILIIFGHGAHPRGTPTGRTGADRLRFAAPGSPVVAPLAPEGQRAAARPG